MPGCCSPPPTNDGICHHGPPCWELVFIPGPVFICFIRQYFMVGKEITILGGVLYNTYECVRVTSV